MQQQVVERRRAVVAEQAGDRRQRVRGDPDRDRLVHPELAACSGCACTHESAISTSSTPPCYDPGRKRSSHAGLSARRSRAGAARRGAVTVAISGSAYFRQSVKSLNVRSCAGVLVVGDAEGVDDRQQRRVPLWRGSGGSRLARPLAVRRPRPGEPRSSACARPASRPPSAPGSPRSSRSAGQELLGPAVSWTILLASSRRCAW